MASHMMQGSWKVLKRDIFAMIVILQNHNFLRTVYWFHLGEGKEFWLTKYVVGAKANPPKNPRRPPKKGKVIATNMVKAERKRSFLKKTQPLCEIINTRTWWREGFTYQHINCGWWSEAIRWVWNAIWLPSQFLSCQKLAWHTAADRKSSLNSIKPYGHQGAENKDSNKPNLIAADNMNDNKHVCSHNKPCRFV